MFDNLETRLRNGAGRPDGARPGRTSPPPSTPPPGPRHLRPAPPSPHPIPQTPAERRPRRRGPPRGGREGPMHSPATILLVDDEPANRHTYGYLFRAAGFTVLEAATG